MPTRPALRRLGLALGLSLLALLGGSASAADGPAVPDAAHGKERVTFGIGPGGQAYIDQRAFLSYTAPPGGQLLDKVAVFNQSNEPLDLLVYPSDAANTRAGALDIRPRAERNSDLGAWVTLGRDSTTGRVVASARSLVRVSVPPQSRTSGIGKVVVPMRVVVPHDATPGDHEAGIVVALLSKGANPSSQNIELEQRVALRVYVRVSGAVHPGLAVQVLRTDYVGGPGLGLHGTLRVTYRLRNTGNTRIGATTSLATRGPFGIGRRWTPGGRVPELVPGGQATLTTDVPDVWSTVLGWVTVTAKALAAPNGDDPHLRPVSAGARFWAITWQEVVALLLVLCWVLYRRWRRARRAEPRHAKGGPAERELVGVGALVLLLALGAGVVRAPGAHAAELGRVEVSPTAGTDQTLMNGAIADAECPKGTGDSFFTVDGPGLPANTAYIGFGNSTGTGYQSFDGASIANIRTENSGAFQRSGTYTIRFSCIRSTDGKTSESYTRLLDYTAGGGGSFRVEGYPSTMPSYHPLPTPADTPADQAQTPAPSAQPAASGSASPAPDGSSPSPAAAAGAGPSSSPPPSAAPAAVAATTSTRGASVTPWLVVIALLFGGVVGLAEWRRRTAS